MAVCWSSSRLAWLVLGLCLLTADALAQARQSAEARMAVWAAARLAAQGEAESNPWKLWTSARLLKGSGASPSGSPGAGSAGFEPTHLLRLARQVAQASPAYADLLPLIDDELARSMRTSVGGEYYGRALIGPQQALNLTLEFRERQRARVMVQAENLARVRVSVLGGDGRKLCDVRLLNSRSEQSSLICEFEPATRTTAMIRAEPLDTSEHLIIYHHN